ncbi:hypothetical protein [Hymenobacter glacieicola]|uniref:Uncharacterized protein n=1 Tax=Hymenobacter glacieicola TaxID=1562124 RepID=A0ABQ1WNP0_9BACT|nr:hypothetical protein [Hymenobacter glacieicola]GGG34164.1 hypothetical protein GCM10011378_08230 [Hymenobacter glacieicola]
MLLNNYSFKEEAETQRIQNELPSNYRSWLEFYDSIPAEHREAQVLRTTYHGAEYYAKGTKPKEYVIQREYLLARLAEELLPLRITEGDYHNLRMAVVQSSFSGAELQGPIWKKLKKSAAQDSE